MTFVAVVMIMLLWCNSIMSKQMGSPFKALWYHVTMIVITVQNQQTPLHLSSASGHVDIVNMLLSHGADIHVKDVVSKI